MLLNIEAHWATLKVAKKGNTNHSKLIPAMADNDHSKASPDPQAALRRLSAVPSKGFHQCSKEHHQEATAASPGLLLGEMG